MYLNYRHDRYSIEAGDKLSLPSEFDKKFALYTPDKYEIEALQVFTPDVLALILDLGIAMDIEVLEGHVLFFVEQGSFIYKFDKHLEVLKNQYNAVVKLMEKIKPELDRFSFEKIGDKPAFM